MGNIYYMPSCAFELYKPETSEKMMEYLKKHISDIERYDTCCRHEMTIPKGATVIYVCSSCAMRLYKQDSTIELKSLWSIIHEYGDYPLPSYKGLKVSVHDACSAKSTPIIHSDVRQLLADMDIEIVENENHSMNSICCGDSLYGNVSDENVLEAMHNRAESMPCDDVVVYCISCMNAMELGGKRPRLLTDLILEEDTFAPVITKTHDEWMKGQFAYIDKH